MASRQRRSVSRALWYRLTRPATSNAVTVATTRSAREFVDGHLIGRTATSESGREAIEDGEEPGAASPLGLMELAQGVEALPDGPASDRPMDHAFGREALGGDTEVLAELPGQGGSVRLGAVGQGREGSHGHGLAADAPGQGINQV